MRKRAGALIIQNKKLLLISEAGQGFYWTPGGGLEQGETFLGALSRELQEELGSRLKTAQQFMEILDVDPEEEVRYFLVEIEMPLEPTDAKTKLYWYSQEDFHARSLPVSKRVFERVYPQLIVKGFV